MIVRYRFVPSGMKGPRSAGQLHLKGAKNKAARKNIVLVLSGAVITDPEKWICLEKKAK